MEYTNEFLARVYGAYMGCEISAYDGNHAINGVSSNGFYINHHYPNRAFNECKLLLTRLSEISDEDAVQVECGYMKNLYSKSFEVMKITRELTGVNIEYRYKDSIEELNNDDGYSYSASKFYFGDRTGHISKFDYLRARGYDCGFGEIPSLIEAGIAIKKQQP